MTLSKLHLNSYNLLNWTYQNLGDQGRTGSIGLKGFKGLRGDQGFPGLIPDAESESPMGTPGPPGNIT